MCWQGYTPNPASVASAPPASPCCHCIVARDPCLGSLQSLASVTHLLLTLPDLLPPSDKQPSDYIGPTWIIRDNLPTS